MKYTDELIKEVKECYPDNTTMHQWAEEGKELLGRYLDDNSREGISTEEVLNATSLEQLHEAANFIKRKKKLYTKWLNEYYEF